MATLFRLFPHLLVLRVAVHGQSCKYLPHKNTIGPHSEQEKHRTHLCSSVESCAAEGAAACNALSDCHSYGIGPWQSHPYNAAQLYSTHWNESIFTDEWTLYACDNDAPPPGPPPPAPCISDLNWSHPEINFQHMQILKKDTHTHPKKKKKKILTNL